MQNFWLRRAETADKKARVDLLNSIEAKGGNVQSLPGLSDSPQLTALRQQEAAISQKEADLVARYNDRHPLVVNVRAEHADIKRAIAAEARRLACNVKNEYELAKAREASLERTLQASHRPERRRRQDGHYSSRTRANSRGQQKSVREFPAEGEDLGTAIDFRGARRARDYAGIAPGAPSYPQIPRTMEIALMIGFVLGNRRLGGQGQAQWRICNPAAD